jgi:hypothetical protein
MHRSTSTHAIDNFKSRILHYQKQWPFHGVGKFEHRFFRVVVWVLVCFCQAGEGEHRNLPFFVLMRLEHLIGIGVQRKLSFCCKGRPSSQRWDCGQTGKGRRSVTFGRISIDHDDQSWKLGCSRLLVIDTLVVESRALGAQRQEGMGRGGVDLVSLLFPAVFLSACLSRPAWAESRAGCPFLSHSFAQLQDSHRVD